MMELTIQNALLRLAALGEAIGSMDGMTQLQCLAVQEKLDKIRGEISDIIGDVDTSKEKYTKYLILYLKAMNSTRDYYDGQ